MTKAETLVAKGSMEPQFSLTLEKAPGGDAVVVASSDAVAKTVGEENGVILVEWTFAPGKPVESATATVRRNGDETRYRFQVKVADDWHLEKRRFPEIICPLANGRGTKRWFMSGRASGGYGHGEGANNANGDSAGAFAATWDEDEGVYFGVEDARNEYRSVGFWDTSSGRVFAEEVFGWDTGDVRADYDVVVRKVSRGARPLVWSDFCDIYREWGERQAWSGKPLAEREDVPDWLKAGAAMTRFSRGWLEDPERLERHLKWWRRTFGDQPVLAAIWGWEKVGTWFSPDYFPCHPDDGTFSKCTALMKEYGFHPFAWPSGLNWSEMVCDLGGGHFRWDGREQWIRPNLAHFATAPDGGHSREAFWLEGGMQSRLCGGDEWSHDWFADVADGLARRGIEVIQIDQSGGGHVPDCWSTVHGHTPGRGAWQIESSRKLIGKVRKTNGIAAVCNEHRCERMNDLVVLQDIRDMETWDECMADVFGYIHHGRMLPFQSNPRRNDLWQLAHMAAEGQMPFFEPRYENSMPLRPALKNGDFEEVTDNARGPECWDRRPFLGGYFKGVDWTKPVWGVKGWSHFGWLGIATKWETKDVHSGTRCLRVVHDAPNWLDSDHPIQLAQTVEGLAPGRYTVSCWVKSENGLAEFKLGSAGGELASVKLPSDCKWTRLELSADVEGELTVLFFAKLGAKFLLDDVRLTQDGRDVMQNGETRWIDFYKRWIALYSGSASKFLVHGRRIRAPEIRCAKIRLGGEGREVDAVCAAAYRADNGEETVVLANGTWEVQKVEIASGGASRFLSLAPGDIVTADLIGTPDSQKWRPPARWRGFNLLGMFCQTKMADGDRRIFGFFPEDRFQWMREWGFNFARLPLDYRFFVEKDDWMKPVEAQLQKLDEAVRYGQLYGIHIQINFHRAPGYCCNPPQEPKSLFRDPEPLAAFTNLWGVLAKRYRGIPNEELSFDLVNEPAPVPFYGATPSNYAAVARAALAAIHAVDPVRFVMSDGWRWGKEPVMELHPFNPMSGESIHCYAPGKVTHHKINNPDVQGPCPPWPPEGWTNGVEWLERNFLEAWRPAIDDGTFLHLGEFGCHQLTVPHATYLAWLEDVLKMCRRHGWGWALWNLDGTFGILDTPRTDCAFENFHGHKLDRKALDILRRY